MNPGRRLLWLGGVAAIALALVAAGLWLRSRDPKQAGVSAPAKSDYVDSAVCASCHQNIFKTYRLTGMGRSLYRPSADSTVEDYRTHNTFYNRASDRYYTMLERDGKWYERRHQIGFGGKETNVVEKPVDYVIGSGNHVRTYLSRTTEGKLIELPVSWYSEKGGYWAMSPGYDRPQQEDFRRAVVSQCVFCHNRYPAPDQISHLDESEPVFGDRVPEGIDCQRCHGPGRAHAEAAGSGRATPDAIRKAIVNPARLTRERQLDVCMQCHLETTSRPLPSWLPKYDRGPFSYRPGEPLGDVFLYFDRSSATASQDNSHADSRDGFEIAHAAYRLRKSKCFLASDMTCTTCHNPHDVPRGEAAVQHYDAVCQGCHAAPHATNKEAQGSCIGCHMPKRRTDDVVHAVMTDHYIQRRKPARDLLAPLREADFEAEDKYRGEVALYYPEKLPQTPEAKLYFDVAQIHDGANLKTGMAKLQQDLQSISPARPEFYFELGKAYARTGNQEQAIHWYEEALRRGPEYRPALAELASVLTSAGQLPRATELLEKAAAKPPPDAVVLEDLGGVYLKQKNFEKAGQYLRQAIALNPDSPEGHNLLGLLLGQQGDWTGAEKELREAISIQPDLTEAQFNLANLLARNNALAEAQYHFQIAISIKPEYAEAHHNLGLLLILMRSYDKATAELQSALRLQPNQAETHSDLADVLAARGQLGNAADQYRSAIQLNPEFYAAHLGLGLILARQGHAAEAREHLQKAAESQNPDVRGTALKALQ